MTPDDRLTRYLSDQAEHIPLPPADPAGVMRRGARRRTRRRAGFVGGLAVVAVLATALAVRDPGADQKVTIDFAAPNVAASTFDWTTVEPASGLASARSTTMLADGSVYSLSTAPGPYREDTYNRPPTLYRSTDGTEWSEASTPQGLSLTSLTASGDTLYALGTAPAGGSARKLVLATSIDRAGSWSSVDLPGELTELEARHPDELFFGTPEVAAADADHLVASVVVTANLDATKYRPELRDHQGGWAWTADGLVVYEAPPAECTPMVEPDGSSTEEEIDARLQEAEASQAECEEAQRSVPRDANGNPPEVARYSYDELGVDPELREHVLGKVYAYVTDDGTTFDRASLPESSGWNGALVRTSDAFHLILGVGGAESAPSTTVMSSPDGRSWTVVASLPGSPMEDAGVLGDRLAVATQDRQGGNIVNVQRPEGTWDALDPAAAVNVPDGETAWTWPITFGPLGMAATVQVSDGENLGSRYLVHSSDGNNLEVLSLDELLPGERAPSSIGMTVTADAIIARFSENRDDDPNTTPPQTVIVGTPAG